jgi:hypothetical protein
MKAIDLSDVNTAVLRALLGSRCLRAAGLGQYDSAKQTVTITVGAKHTDDVLTVTINGVDETYTVLVGDADNAAVATALAAVLDANADVTAAAVGAVITVASATADAFTISQAVTGVGATTTLTIAGTIQGTKQVETDNAIVYVIDGQLYGKAAATAIVITGSEALPVSSFRWYSLQADTSAALSTKAQTDNVNEIPAADAGKVIIGAFKIVTDATHTFTPALTPVNGAGITTTFFDLSCVPKAGYPA